MVRRTSAGPVSVRIFLRLWSATLMSPKQYGQVLTSRSSCRVLKAFASLPGMHHSPLRQKLGYPLLRVALVEGSHDFELAQWSPVCWYLRIESVRWAVRLLRNRRLPRRSRHDGIGVAPNVCNSCRFASSFPAFLAAKPWILARLASSIEVRDLPNLAEAAAGIHSWILQTKLQAKSDEEPMSEKRGRKPCTALPGSACDQVPDHGRRDDRRHTHTGQ